MIASAALQPLTNSGTPSAWPKSFAETDINFWTRCPKVRWRYWSGKRVGMPLPASERQSGGVLGTITNRAGAYLVGSGIG